MEVSTSDRLVGPPAFTCNPQDRYLTPVPPKILVPTRLGDICRETYKVPTYAPESVRSNQGPTLAPRPNRRMRSATLSPLSGTHSAFPDLNEVKDKVTSRIRSSSDSRTYKGNPDARSLKIGLPVLISSTAEDMKLVSLRPSIPGNQSPRQAHIAKRMKEFSPLGSHPVDLNIDLGTVKDENSKRPRSHNPTVDRPMLKPAGRVRANSADTRRAKYHHWANEPWLTSPKLPPGTVTKDTSKPKLEQPKMNNMDLPSQSTSGRPVSRGGRVQVDSRTAPVDKGLPALPRYLVPAPLFACNSTRTTPLAAEQSYDSDTRTDVHAVLEVRSNRSSSSIESRPTSDQSELHSPTFSSFTSGSSQADLSPRHSTQSHTQDHEAKCTSTTGSEHLEPGARHTVGPPMLRIPVTFGEPNSPGSKSRTSVSSRRRQAACFGYSGSDIQTTTTVQGSPKPTTEPTRLNSTGQFEALMVDFGFLGEAVH